MMRGSRASSRSRTRNRLTCTSIERSSGAVAPHRQVHELVAIEHAVGMLHEHREQPELGPAQRHDYAVRRDQLPRRRIERPSGEAHAPRIAARERQAAVRRRMLLMRASSSRGLNGFAR